MSCSKLKILLMISAAVVLCLCQVYLTIALTNRTTLSLPLCVLLSSIPLAVYMIWIVTINLSPKHTATLEIDYLPAIVPGNKLEVKASVRQNILSVVVLAIVLFILFHKSLFGGKGLVPADGIFLAAPWKGQTERKISNYLLEDQFTVFIPQHHLLHSEMLKGKLPLWNPYIACGIPLVASMQAAALFPINLAFSYLDPFTANGLKAFVKLLLAGFFMILYMKRLGVGQLSAVLSGLVFSMCSFMIVWLGHPHVNCAMWLPLLFYFIEGEFQKITSGATIGRASWRRSLRNWVGFSVAYGLMFLGGHPSSIVHISIVTGCYFCFRLVFTQTKRFVCYRILFLISGICCGLMLAAPQLLTFLEYYSESSSAVASAIMKRWLFHLDIPDFIYYFMPHISGSPAHGFERLKGILGSVKNFNERTAFVGIVPLYLSFLTLIYKRNRIIIFYFVLILLCLCTIFGVWPFLSVIRHIPVIKYVDHTRLILFVCFSLAVLAGFGLDGLAQLRSGTKWKVLIVIWLTTIGLLFWIVILFAEILTGNYHASKSFVLRQLLVFCAGIIMVSLIIIMTRPRFREYIPKLLALSYVCFELLWFAMDYNPSIQRKDYYPTTGGIEFLKQDDQLFRIASFDGVLPVNTVMMYGIYDVRGVDFTTVRRYEELATGRVGNFWFYSTDIPPPPWTGLFNIKYLPTCKERQVPLPFRLVYQGEISIYQVKSFVERAIAVFEYVLLPDKESVLATIRSATLFDPRKVVFLEQQPVLPVGYPKSSVVPATPAVSIVDYQTDEVTVNVSVDRSALLVLLDTYFPGWKAFVNGKETPIYRANYNFRAVAVPEGKSTVHFVYKPASFRIGCSLSLAGIMFLVSALIFVGKKHKKSAVAEVIENESSRATAIQIKNEHVEKNNQGQDL